MIFFFRSVFPQFLLNAFIVYRICKSKDIHLALKWFLSVIYGTEFVLYLTGLFFSLHLSIETFALIQKISIIWIITQIYLTALILVFDLLIFTNRKWSYLYGFNPKKLKKAKVISFILLIVFILSQIYLGSNSRQPDIKNYGFNFNKHSEIGQTPVEEYKLLVISDLHLGYIIDRKVLKNYVDIIIEQQADIIVVNGDLIDFSLRPLLLENMGEELRRLKPSKGLYFIPGNHEYKFNYEEKFAWIRNCGFTILQDSVASIDNKLFLIGRDDRSRKDKRKSIENLMEGVDLNKPCIFFSHQPGDISDSYQYGIPLTICGHTHSGQIFPVNLLGRLFYTNVYGFHKRGDCISYTTSGLGFSGIPLKIASNSEIVIFDIYIY